MKTKFVPLALVALSACATYPPPEESGLIAVRPYPGPDDICQVIGENDLTNQHLDHTELLIGCPLSESGAISDRTDAGARVVDVVGDWVLLSQPL